MVKSCCAVGCTNRFKKKGDGGVRLYRFPADPHRKALWTNAVKRADLDNQRKTWSPSTHSYLCAAHFVGGEKNEDPLHPAYVPTLFDFTSACKTRRAEESLKRHRRSLAVQIKKRSASAMAECSHDTTELESCGGITEPSQQRSTTISTQTDLDMVTLSKMEADLQTIRTELLEARSTVSCVSEGELKKDVKRVVFYTGLPNFAVLMLVFNFLFEYVPTSVKNVLSPFQEMMLFLMKLRLNVFEQDLAYRFNVSQPSVSRICSKWLNVAHQRLKWLIKWPAREELRMSIPKPFKDSFPRCVAVIDCFEVALEKPSDFNARASSWSNYKQKNTCKYLIAITPQGSISFVSKGWGGRASDKQMTEESGFLDLLLPGDQILADRGFTIQESAGIHYAEVIIPDFTRGKKQLSGGSVERSRKIAHVRIHVERVIGMLRQKYTVLSGTLPISVLGRHDTERVDKIVNVCAALCNLCASVVPQS